MAGEDVESLQTDVGQLMTRLVATERRLADTERRLVETDRRLVDTERLLARATGEDALSLLVEKLQVQVDTLEAHVIGTDERVGDAQRRLHQMSSTLRAAAAMYSALSLNGEAELTTGAHDGGSA